MPGLDYSTAGLVAASGGTDPWELARAVTDAHPDTLRVIGTSFRDRGTDAAEVAHSGALADHALAGAHTTDGRPVFDADGSGRRSRLLLSGDGIALTDTGAVYYALADDLTDAQNSAGRWLQAITDDVNAVIAARNTFFAEYGRNLLPEDADAADRGYHADAARFVREGTARVQAVLGVYDDQVAGHTTRLAGLPHAPPATPAAAAPAPEPGPLEVAGALGAGLVNGLASLGNAIAHNPGEAIALAGGVALAGISAVGVASGGLATATGIGAVPGIPLTGLSLAGVATGGAIATVAGAEILRDALGADRVTPLGANPFGDTFPGAAAVAPTMIDANGNPWDANEQWEKIRTAAIPEGENIAHDGGSRAHIPWGSYGENGKITGGHWWEAGVANKTVFPEGWDPPTILERTLDVARNPDRLPTIDPETGNWQVVGTRDGVEILVSVKPEGTLVTAHPISGPGVATTDENGDLRPPDDN